MFYPPDGKLGEKLKDEISNLAVQFVIFTGVVLAFTV